MSATRLTKPQRELLQRFADDRYGDLYIRGQRRRTVGVLCRVGYVRAGYDSWYSITPEGRAALAPPAPGEAPSEGGEDA